MIRTLKPRRSLLERTGTLHESVDGPSLEAIRQAGEEKLERILRDSDEEARKILRDALNQYGSLEAVPESVWRRIRDHYADNDALAAAILLLWVSADDWTASQLSDQGVAVREAPPLASYAIAAAKQTRSLATTVDTIRDRLSRKIQDSRLTGPGGVGELTETGIDSALSDTFTPARRQTIAADQTTGAISGGQLGARDRLIGGDGAASGLGGQRMTIALIWRTERDNLVCARCSPLEGQPEEVWSQVFPEGPGPDAHPNCRCSLEPQAIAMMEP